MDGSLGVGDGSRSGEAFAVCRQRSWCDCTGDRNRHAYGIGAGTIAVCSVSVGLRVGIVADGIVVAWTKLVGLGGRTTLELLSHLFNC